MEPVLILTYIYPPCTLSATQRPYYWAKYLPDYGYYPIVVTRRWNEVIKTAYDWYVDSENKETDHFKNDKEEVFILPYIGSARDKFLSKYGPSEKNLQRKMLTLREKIVQNFSYKIIPYHNIYLKSRELIKDRPEIRKVIITANPFMFFHFGYLLKKEFPHIEWIADYRDDWTTTELTQPKGVLEKIIRKLERRSEKKWMASAKYFTSVSSHYVKKIQSLIGVEGFELINGYGDEMLEGKREQLDPGQFVITYNGTLYNSQPIEVFLDAIKKVMASFGDQIEIVLKFPGLSYDLSQKERVENYMQEYLNHLFITPRIPKEEVIEIQRKSNLVLLMSHGGLKGVPGSKLYEYVGLRKKVLLFPSDNDIVEQTLRDTGLGLIAHSEQEIVRFDIS